MKLIFKLLLILFMLNLSSCFSPVKIQRNCTYMLNVSPPVAIKRQHRSVLLVTMPETSSIYNTTSMAYSTHPYQIAYFGLTKWAETPPEMLQQLMIQSLQNTHYFKAVVAPPFIGSYDYILSTQILSIKQNFRYQPAQAELVVQAQLTNTVNNHVIVAKTFTVSVPMQERSPYAGVAAMNRATAVFLQELTEFCLNHLPK